jgi:hypothetical protein
MRQLALQVAPGFLFVVQMLYFCFLWGGVR